jgi:hypothetical protein
MPFNPLRYPATFLEPEWITPESAWLQHIPFAFSLVQMLTPSRVVELGVHAGDSYCAFCQAMKHLNLAGQCFGIDTWAGDEHTGPYSGQVLSTLREHHDARYGSFSNLIQSDFDSAVSRFENGSIDLLHIDGLHTYAAVRHDFESWLPKLSHQAVVLFHDTAVRQGDFGVYQFWSEAAALYPHFEFLHGMGLGVLCIGGEAPDAVRDLCQLTLAEANMIRRFYFRLGREISLRNYYTGVMQRIAQTRSLVDHWKRATAQDTQPANHFENALKDPAAATDDLFEQVRLLVSADLNLRR